MSIAIDYRNTTAYKEGELIKDITDYIRHRGIRPRAEFVYDLAAQMKLKVKDPYLLMQKAEEYLANESAKPLPQNEQNDWGIIGDTLSPIFSFIGGAFLSMIRLFRKAFRSIEEKTRP